MGANAPTSSAFLFTHMNYYTTKMPRLQWSKVEMAMAALPNILTVDEFRELPEGGEFAYELHHGEVVPVTRHAWGPWTIQKRLERLLEQKLEQFVVGTEFAYRPLSEYELRVADVAAASHERARAIDASD